MLFVLFNASILVKLQVGFLITIYLILEYSFWNRNKNENTDEELNLLIKLFFCIVKNWLSCINGLD